MTLLHKRQNLIPIYVCLSQRDSTILLSVFSFSIFITVCWVSFVLILGIFMISINSLSSYYDLFTPCHKTQSIANHFVCTQFAKVFVHKSNPIQGNKSEDATLRYIGVVLRCLALCIVHLHTERSIIPLSHRTKQFLFSPLASSKNVFSICRCISFMFSWNCTTAWMRERGMHHADESASG